MHTHSAVHTHTVHFRCWFSTPVPSQQLFELRPLRITVMALSLVSYGDSDSDSESEGVSTESSSAKSGSNVRKLLSVLPPSRGSVKGKVKIGLPTLNKVWSPLVCIIMSIEVRFNNFMFRMTQTQMMTYQWQRNRKRWAHVIPHTLGNFWATCCPVECTVKSSATEVHTMLLATCYPITKFSSFTGNMFLAISYYQRTLCSVLPSVL